MGISNESGNKEMQRRPKREWLLKLNIQKGEKMGYKIERTIDAPVEKVWLCWTSAEETQRWLAPKSRVNFIVDGAYEFFWNSEDPSLDSTIGCKLKLIENEQRILFEWQGKAEFLEMFTTPHAPTLIEVTFDREEDCKTRLILEQKETRDLEKWGEYDKWMYGAWVHAIDSLQEYVENTGNG